MNDVAHIDKTGRKSFIPVNRMNVDIGGTYAYNVVAGDKVATTNGVKVVIKAWTFTEEGTGMIALEFADDFKALMPMSTQIQVVDTMTPASLKAEVKSVDLKTCADPTDGDNIGVFAQAQIIFAKPEGGSIIGPIIRSAGIWGVEVDTTTELDYLRELGEEEFSALEDMLKALGLAMPQEYSQTLWPAPYQH